jgi:phosphoenolpyruvate carboxykinase (GTP)
VLSWIVDRVHGRAFALESPYGWMPRHEDLSWKALDYPASVFREVMAIDRDAAALEVRQHEELFDKFLDRLPKEFLLERELLRLRLWRSPEHWELAGED